MENILLKSSIEKTLVLICADHCQSQVSPENNMYLEDVIPDIEDLSYVTKNGDLTIPLGSQQNYFIKLRNRYESDKIKFILQNKLGDNYSVKTLQNLISEGIVVDTEIMSLRMPDIVVLPKENYSFQTKKKHLKDGNRGHHGGLTEIEMFTPLISINLENLGK